MSGRTVPDHKARQCAKVLVGAITPWECQVFGTACTPERPIGMCMVSSEGACAAYYAYGRHRDGAPQGPDGRAVLPAPASARLAFTTDSYLVKPLVFPGGDIGALAVHGTVNNLAVAGARPLWLAAGFVPEEKPVGLVLLDTAFGGRRIVDRLVGDPLPRIC